MDQLTAFLFERFAKSVLTWDENDVRDIYAISIYADFTGDREGEFALLLGYNTISRWQTHARDWQLDPVAARWDILFWPSNEQVSVANFDDGVCAPEDVAAVNAMLDELGLNLDIEQIGEVLASEDYEEHPLWLQLCRRDEYLLKCCTEAGRQLHETGIVLAKFGRAIPIIIYETEHLEGEVELTRKANPEGLVWEFEQWIATEER